MDLLVLVGYFVIGVFVSAYVDTRRPTGPVLFGMIAYGWSAAVPLYVLGVLAGVFPGRMLPDRPCRFLP